MGHSDDRVQKKGGQTAGMQMTHSQLKPVFPTTVPDGNQSSPTTHLSTSFNFASIDVVQPKLTIGEPNDEYEQEADQVASEVVNKIHRSQDTSPEDEEESVQRSVLATTPISSVQRDGGIVSGAASSEFESQLSQARHGGSSLEPQLRGQMESAMGADFSRVKIHTDTQADQLSRSIQAKAFTTGQDVFFKQGEYNPGSRTGQGLIAHELTHVVQQNSHSVQRNLQLSQPGRLAIQRDPEGQIGVRNGHEDKEWERYQINMETATQQLQGQELRKFGKQGLLGDCWIVSSIIALGYTKPEKLLASVEEGTSDTIDDDIQQTFKVKLHPMNDGSGVNLAPNGDEPEEVEVDTQLPVSTQETLLYAGRGSKEPVARLIGVIEKALAVKKGLGSYANLGSDSARRALGMLTGESTQSLDLVTTSKRTAVTKLKELQTNIGNTTVVINSSRPKKANPIWKKDKHYGPQINEIEDDRRREAKIRKIRRAVDNNATGIYEWSNPEPHAMAVLGFSGDEMTVYDQGLGHQFKVSIDDLVSNDYCYEKIGTRNDRYDFKWKFEEIIWIDWPSEQSSDENTTDTDD